MKKPQPEIAVSSVMKANTLLVLENHDLKERIAALELELAARDAKIAQLNDDMLNSAPRVDHERMTSFIGRIEGRKEIKSQLGSHFEIFLDTKSPYKSPSILLRFPENMLEKVRGMKKDELSVVSARMTPTGLVAVRFGTVLSRFVIERHERVTEKDLQNKGVRTYATAESGDRVKIVSNLDEGVASRPPGSTIDLEGVFRSIKVKETYYPFFITAARLEEEMARRLAMKNPAKQELADDVVENLAMEEQALKKDTSDTDIPF